MRARKCQKQGDDESDDPLACSVDFGHDKVDEKRNGPNLPEEAVERELAEGL